jgi:hypothetical protein
VVEPPEEEVGAESSVVVGRIDAARSRQPR